MQLTTPFFIHISAAERLSRRTFLNNAVYLVRHIGLARQRVEGLAALEWNAVASPLGAVNGQDGTKDEFCVRLTSTWFSQDACFGV
jgi:hypothetical protein